LLAPLPPVLAAAATAKTDSNILLAHMPASYVSLAVAALYH
jgi:hypothetical protein